MQARGELILLLLLLSHFQWTIVEEGLRLLLKSQLVGLDGIAPEECGWFAFGLFPCIACAANSLRAILMALADLRLRLRIERGLINLLFHSYLKMIFSLIMIAYVAYE